MFYYIPLFIIFTKIFRQNFPRVDEYVTLLIYFIQATVIHLFYEIHKNLWTILSKNNRPPRPGDKTISTKWLNKQLHDKGLIKDDLQVVAAEFDNLQGNRGLCSYINVIKITYNKEDADAPKSLFLKSFISDNFRSRLINIASGRYREAYFLDHFKNIKCIPKPVYLYSSQITGNYLIIMEDLKGRSTGVNFYFGNQVWGMKPLDKPREQKEMLKEIYLKAAEMHASYWNDKNLLKKRWLKGVSWYNGQERATWSMGVNAGKRFWDKTRKNINFNESKSGEVKWSQKLVSIVDKSFENSTWEKLQEQLNDSTVPFTLTHGDFHAANMLYLMDTSDNPLVWVDWSEVGVWEPMADIGQIVISDVKSEIRRKHEKELVKQYWDELVRLGVSSREYSFEQCWKSYQVSPIERWIWMFAILTGLNLPPNAIQYFHDQLLAFIEDHSDLPYYILRPISPIL